MPRTRRLQYIAGIFRDTSGQRFLTFSDAKAFSGIEAAVPVAFLTRVGQSLICTVKYSVRILQEEEVSAYFLRLRIAEMDSVFLFDHSVIREVGRGARAEVRPCRDARREPADDSEVFPALQNAQSAGPDCAPPFEKWSGAS